MKKGRHKNKRQLTLYYDSKSELGRKTYATAQASNLDLFTVNLAETKVSGTTWMKLARALNKTVPELIDQQHNVFKSIYGNEEVELTAEDAIKIIVKHPETLIFPIAVRGDRCIQIEDPGDIHYLFDTDSRGTNITNKNY
ncbi:MAG TPA: hypothetical protein VK021_02645 [Flavobacteriaceae bacterium]|nr:hypothetical protein [Flavobacteriaceae bacterium]